jgi:hypothetical protein
MGSIGKKEILTGDYLAGKMGKGRPAGRPRFFEPVSRTKDVDEIVSKLQNTNNC